MRDQAEAIRRYAERVEEILRGQHATRDRLEKAARHMEGLVLEDARTRWLGVRDWGERIGLWDLGTSVHELAGMQLEHETRFSLLLAALLDPKRTPETAPHVWARLVEALSRMGRNQQDVAKCWRPELLEDLEIWPQRHGSEWNRIDVFGQVTTDRGHEFGLVIEVKISQTTGEQPKQLDRYHRLVKKRWPGAEMKTFFVYLTDDGRMPTTAEVSWQDWAVLGWQTIAEILLDVAGTDGLSHPAKRLMLQAHDAVKTEILGGQSLAAIVSALGDLSRDCTDAVLYRDHASITSLWALQPT